MTKKSSVQDFADKIESDPQDIVDWCLREIKCYKDLIKILKKRVNKNGKDN